ncbi:MAG TPA: cysteine desulfurase family protein, partial [Rubrobacter sp.]|nr:cysteine desulfurase family protein [Rubrobacter sp.]
MAHPVYLDNAATTPLDQRVLEAMLPHMGTGRGNPSSLHALGTAAREAIEGARDSVAALVGASPAEIVFTSGGTEADDLAILGLARSAPREKRHVLVSPVEHAAVREAARHLESEGYEVTAVEVDEDGLVDPVAFAAALRPDTALAAVVWANNEVGTVEPVRELAEICAEREIPLHSDAVQAAGRETLDVGDVPVSTLALSAHKLYGPQGVGALYVREDVSVQPISYGGGQEGGLRSGTQNVAGIVGFGVAARLAREELDERVAHEGGLRDAIVAGVAGIPDVGLNGHPERRLSNNVHLSVEGVEAESLVLFLNALGYAIGSGSACSSGEHKASPVLLAMG